jgi:hypothetical protein
MRKIHCVVLDADIPDRGLYNARAPYSVHLRDILAKATSRLNKCDLVKGVRLS